MSNNKLTYGFTNEYMYFVSHYLLALLGIPEPTASDDAAPNYRLEPVASPAASASNRDSLHDDPPPALVDNQDRTYIFRAASYPICTLTLSGGATLPAESIALANEILAEFLSVCQYKYTGSGKQMNLGLGSSLKWDTPRSKPNPSNLADLVYRHAIQQGICRWVVGSSAGPEIQRFFRILDTWTDKTYEGRRVTLGFIIDPSVQATGKLRGDRFLDFLSTDSAAVFTDCIYSVFLLDAQCGLVSHLSVPDAAPLEDAAPPEDIEPPKDVEPNFAAPLRFTQIISQITESRVGVFLLNNGDIILSKKKKVQFVKRNGQWLNFSYTAFCNALDPFLQTSNLRSGLLESIYASVLDVSFSHTGGIISVVNTTNYIPESDATTEVKTSLENEVLNPFDNLRYPDRQLPPFSKKDSDPILKKKWLNRDFVRTMVGGKSFSELDRKLRSELIALDGACILDVFGTPYAFGAIISYDSGSTSGGRAAAAIKLSRFGMAVKISTDGYIELYIGGTKVYQVK